MGTAHWRCCEQHVHIVRGVVDRKHLRRVYFCTQATLSAKQMIYDRGNISLQAHKAIALQPGNDQSAHTLHRMAAYVDMCLGACQCLLQTRPRAKEHSA